MEDLIKVLIVDDDVNICETLQDILIEKGGYMVTVAHSGVEAISLAKEYVQDMIFLDMRLPVMSGLEIYLAIREFDAKVPVIIMTAYQFELKHCVDEALLKGAQACIHKPVDAEVVFKVLEEAGKNRGEHA